MALKYGVALGSSSAMDSADDLSAAMWRLTGDGVCARGSKFESSVEGRTLTLGSGYGLAAGRWVESDAPLELEVSPGWSHRDRQDIVAIEADIKERRARLVVLEGVDPEHLPDEPYTVPLYLLHIKRGATNLLSGDVTDLREYVPTLASLTKDGLRAYKFTNGGIDLQVDNILAYGEQVVKKAEKAVSDLSGYIEQSGVGPGIGELSTGLNSPGIGWLLCDGGYIPAAYRELRAVLGNYLPNITHEDNRFSTWVYGGERDSV